MNIIQTKDTASGNPILEEKHKQRLVGAMVLVALAIIFLPGLLYREEVVEVSIPDPIPPAPTFEPVTIEPPTKPEIELRTEPVFAPEATTTKQEDAIADKPSLTKQGVPKAWVVQVASLKLKKSADTLVKRLQADNHKAYWQQANTSQGSFYRVFVGPLIDKSRAEAAKKQIDQAQKVTSRVLRFNPTSGN